MPDTNELISLDDAIWMLVGYKTEVTGTGFSKEQMHHWFSEIRPAWWVEKWEGSQFDR